LRERERKRERKGWRERKEREGERKGEGRKGGKGGGGRERKFIDRTILTWQGEVGGAGRKGIGGRQ